MSKYEAPHRDVIHLLDRINAKEGLGTDLYEAVSRLTPSISVEAVIKNSDASKTLLIWRNDKMYGPGWHLPGGVLRFKETLKISFSRGTKILKKHYVFHQVAFFFRPFA